ncbi:MAG: ribonuclease P protein component [Acidocella sp. 20-61-6]|nr:MAG: ribonuclease P protein component [Acidocella sp. 20-61-6]
MAKLSPPETLKRRAEFLALAARGKKLAKRGFVLQWREADGAAGLAELQAPPLRVGFTATKKLGNAVARNRARRRLREAVRLTCAGRDLRGLELVLICRQETAAMQFTELCAGLAAALPVLP